MAENKEKKDLDKITVELTVKKRFHQIAAALDVFDYEAVAAALAAYETQPQVAAIKPVPHAAGTSLADLHPDVPVKLLSVLKQCIEILQSGNTKIIRALTYNVDVFHEHRADKGGDHTEPPLRKGTHS